MISAHLWSPEELLSAVGLTGNKVEFNMVDFVEPATNRFVWQQLEYL